MIHLNIGSNLNFKNRTKTQNISLAVHLLSKLNIKIKKISNFFRTPSYPNKKLPRFLNVGLMVECNLTNFKLLKQITLIEKKIGRVKSSKNDPRVCDIDIIDFNGQIINNKNLVLPHPRCYIRNFVLYPIKQIDPEWMHPVLKKNVDFLIDELSQNSRLEITRLKKSVII